jgi:DNA-binding transcriptional LysR family regulator
MLDSRRLQILVEVARTGSLSAAADALHLTQPAVSKQIALLEREAGLALLHRTSRGVSLTEGGRVLVEHAYAVLDRLIAAESALHDLAGLRAGTVRIGAFPTAFATLMPRGLREFRRRWPAVHVEARSADPLPASVLVGRGELDVAVTYDHAFAPLPEDSRLERRPLLDDPMLVALPHDHPLAGHAAVPLAELRHDPWVLSSTEAMARLVQYACQEAGFIPRVAAESPDPISIEGLVAADVGVTLVPTLVRHISRPDIVLRPLDGSRVVRRIHLTLTRGHSSPATAAAVKTLTDLAETLDQEEKRERPPASAWGNRIAPRPRIGGALAAERSGDSDRL